MVCLDLDHPDIEEFIDWKVIEEQKVAAMVTGSKICAQRLNAVLKACHIVDAEGALEAAEPRSDLAFETDLFRPTRDQPSALDALDDDRHRYVGQGRITLDFQDAAEVFAGAD